MECALHVYAKTINLAQGQQLGCLAVSGVGLGCHEKGRREVLLEASARRP